MKTSMKLLPVITGLFLSSLPLGAAVIPYTNDFSGSGSNTAFTNENLDANWTVSGGSYVYSTSATNFPASTASISLTNASAVSFTMETQFTVTSTMLNANANGMTIGFGLYGSDAVFTGANASNSYYLADINVATTAGGGPGTIRLLSVGDSAGFSAVNGLADDNVGSSTLAITQNTTYTLRLDGVYTSGTLSLTLGLYNAAGTTQIGTSATATDTSPLTGTNFGYRNRIGIGSGSFGANFDNFSVVPEPGTVGFLAVGLTALFVRRRWTSRIR